MSHNTTVYEDGAILVSNDDAAHIAEALDLYLDQTTFEDWTEYSEVRALRVLFETRHLRDERFDQ